ncbi:MAG TPA: hypothetical protein VIF37_00115 [Methylobacter sp.]
MLCYIAAITLGLSSQSNATEHHTAQALGHSAMANKKLGNGSAVTEDFPGHRFVL